MWIEIDLASFSVSCEGSRPVRTEGPNTLYASTGLESLRAIEDLEQSEYGQAVEVEGDRRTVRFGRDYLGHYPLAYAVTARKLYIGDDISRLVRSLRAEGIEPKLSAQSLALYFAMGYIPDGRSAYREVSMCQPHSLYEWRDGAVKCSNVFRPIEADPRTGLDDLEAAIEREVAKLSRPGRPTDVWCSGGLDSSIVAQRFNDGGRRADLVTLGYGQAAHDEHGDGERAYARAMAQACGAAIREADLSDGRFEIAHATFARTHNMPVIDICVPAKYVLASISGPFAITGEGSDPLFAGPKNSLMLHATERNPALSLGWLYGLAHGRFFSQLEEILANGKELATWVTEYLDALFDRYPGDLLRKLFYLNMHVKAGSLIFTEGYYAGRAHDVTVRHPYAGLDVYSAAFRLEDHHKYRFPHDKLALRAIYGGRLPKVILDRRKSGTQIPLSLYLEGLAPAANWRTLEESGLFRGGFLDRMQEPQARADHPLLTYALFTLASWLTHKGGTTHAHLPSAPGHHEERGLVEAL